MNILYIIKYYNILIFYIIYNIFSLYNAESAPPSKGLKKGVLENFISVSLISYMTKIEKKK